MEVENIVKKCLKSGAKIHIKNYKSIFQNNNMFKHHFRSQIQQSEWFKLSFSMSEKVVVPGEPLVLSAVVNRDFKQGRRQRKGKRH